MNIKLVEFFDDHFYKVEYEKDGKPFIDYLPSVTTKLGAVAKPWLGRWRGDVGNREADLRVMEGADRGSRIHYAWYVYMNGGGIIYQPPKKPIYTKEELDDLFKKFEGNIVIIQNQDEMVDMCKLQKWCKIVKPTLLLAEHIVYSIEDRDAGTLDDLLMIDKGKYAINGTKLIELEGGAYVFDLKSGSVVGDEAKMQVSRYAKLAEKMGIAEVKGALIGHTGSKTKTGIEGMATIYLNKDEIEQWNADYLKVASIWQRLFGTMKPKVFDIPALITLKKS